MNEPYAARDAMARLRGSYERARAIDERPRIQSFLDALNHEESELARSYIGQPIEIAIVKIAIRLEAHIAASTHEPPQTPWRAIGVGIGALIAGSVAAGTAVREMFVVRQ